MFVFPVNFCCKRKIKINYPQRAETLIGSLGSEKDRWSESALALNDSLVNVVGDVLLAGGCVAYLGCFTVDVRITYRVEILHSHKLHDEKKMFHVLRAVTFTRITLDMICC